MHIPLGMMNSDHYALQLGIYDDELLLASIFDSSSFFLCQRVVVTALLRHHRLAADTPLQFAQHCTALVLQIKIKFNSRSGAAACSAVEAQHF
jgi:hypothetical protein